MKVVGHLSPFTWIDFTQRVCTVKMNQSKCIEKIFERFRMAECQATPSEIKCDLAPDRDKTYQRRYREKLGSLISIMTCTRPDISRTVIRLSQYMFDPREKHMTTLRHVYRHLQGTQSYVKTSVKQI